MLQIRDFTKSRNAEIEYVKITKRLRLCKDDDILIGRYGASVGKILTGLAGAYNVAIIKSIPNEELIRKDFIRRYFESSLFQSILFKVCTSRAAQAGFSKDDIKDELIPVPSLSEQQSIVDYLDSAFVKIDAMKANAEKALNEAKALFQASLKEMLEPKEGWEEKMLKEVGRTQTGTTPSKSVTTYYGGEIPFIRPAELDIDGKGGINYNSELKLTSEGALKSRIIRANSTLMCCIGSVGKTGYATQDVTCNQQINTITPYEAYNDRYVYYSLLAPSFQNEVIKIANSAKATLAIISKGKWEELSIHFPLLSEQQFIAEVLDSLSSKVSELKANYDKISQECDALKQAILRQVFE
jgi:type I restriction enzyme S subunit